MVNGNHFAFKLLLAVALAAGPIPMLIGSAQAREGEGIVTIQAAAPKTPAVGRPLIFSVSVENDAANQRVWVEDFLPTGVSLVSVTPSQGTCDASHDGVSGREVVGCALGEVGSGRAAKVEILVTPRVPGAGTNRAVATAEFAPTTPTNSSEATVKVKPVPESGT